MSRGPLILPSLTSGSGPTARDYWHDLAGQIGRFQTFTVSSAASSGEAPRVVLVDDLTDDDVEADEFNGAWLYVCDGDQAGAQRRLLSTDGYLGAVGALVLSRPFPSPLRPGTTVAITEPLPVVDSRGVKGLLTLISEALKRLRVDARISFEGDGTQRVSLAAFPWIRGTHWTDGVYDWKGLTTDRPSRLSSAEYDVTVNGGTVTLELERAYGPSDTFELKVFAPADLLLYDGTAWGYTSRGFLSDDDQAAAPVRHVTTVAMVKGLDFLLHWTMGDDRLPEARRTRLLTRYDRSLPQWAKAAERVIQEQPKRTRELPRRIVSVTSWRGRGSLGFGLRWR